MDCMSASIWCFNYQINWKGHLICKSNLCVGIFATGCFRDTRLRHDVNRSCVQCLLLLIVSNPNLPSCTSTAALGTAGVSWPTHQHPTVEEHLLQKQEAILFLRQMASYTGNSLQSVSTVQSNSHIHAGSQHASFTYLAVLANELEDGDVVMLGELVLWWILCHRFIWDASEWEKQSQKSSGCLATAPAHPYGFLKAVSQHQLF